MSVPRQGSFGGGIWRSLRAPAGYVYDASEAFVGDDGVELYKRGGSSYENVNDFAGAEIQGMAAFQSDIGSRTLVWDSSRFTRDPGGVSLVDLTTTGGGYTQPRTLSRAHGMEGLLLVVSDSVPNDTAVWAYGGAASGANWTPGVNTTFTAGSDQATIAAGFTANARPGMFIYAPAATDQFIAIVKSVESDTSLTLTRPWVGTTGPVAATYYMTRAVGAPLTKPGGFIAAVPGPRVIVASGSIVAESKYGDPFAYLTTDFHALPANAQALGADSIRNVGVVFTTQGVFTISNLDLNITDSAGNAQQRLERVEQSIVLWADPGIGRWSDGLIVPALDDVYLFSLDTAPVPLSEGIRGLYRSYVAAGYTTGLATVFKGHYFLPILNGSTWVDTFVCRLDLRSRDRRALDRRALAWTRLAGAGGSSKMYVTKSVTETTFSTDFTPKLLAASGKRILRLTDIIGGTKTTDHDATVPVFDVTTNDIEPPTRSTLTKVRLGYELTDAAADNPTISASISTGAEGSAFTALSGTADENDGSTPKAWKVTTSGRRSRRWRLRFVNSTKTPRLRLRSLEWFVRDSNRP